MKVFWILLLITLTIYGQSVSTLSFDRFSHYDVNDWISYGSSNYITSMDMGYDVMYIGTRNGGVLRYDLFSNKWLTPLTVSQGLRENKILRLAYDLTTSQLYALTPSGVDVYNKGFGFWKPASEQEMPAPNSTPLAESRKNGFFAPYNRPAISAFPNLFTNPSVSLMNDGTIIGPYGFDYKITDRLVDNNNILWIGTNGIGLGRANLVDQHVTFKRRYLPQIEVNDVLVRGGQLWIAGRSPNQKQPEITLWNRKNNRWRYFKSGHSSAAIISPNITVVAGATNRTVYFGTSQGVFAKPPKKDWKSLLNGVIGDYPVFDIKSYKGETYVATDNGVFVIDDQTLFARQLKRSVLMHVPVSKIASNGHFLYFGSDRGVFEYDRKKETISMLEMPNAISSNYITAIAVNHDSLWFSGAYGIGVYDLKNKTARSFPIFNNNRFNAVADIAATEFYLWFATDHGLLKYDPERDYWYLYTTEDGLIGNNIKHIDVDGDYLWLSTPQGLTRFRWYNDDRYE